MLTNQIKVPRRIIEKQFRVATPLAHLRSLSSKKTTSIPCSKLVMGFNRWTNITFIYRLGSYSSRAEKQFQTDLESGSHLLRSKTSLQIIHSERLFLRVFDLLVTSSVFRLFLRLERLKTMLPSGSELIRGVGQHLDCVNDALLMEPMEVCCTSYFGETSRDPGSWRDRRDSFFRQLAVQSDIRSSSSPHPRSLMRGRLIRDQPSHILPLHEV